MKLQIIKHFLVILFIQIISINLNQCKQSQQEDTDILNSQFLEYFNDIDLKTILYQFNTTEFQNKNFTIIDNVFDEILNNNNINKNDKSDKLICKSCQSLLSISIDKLSKIYKEKIIEIITNLGTEYCIKDFFVGQDQACRNVSEPMAQIVYYNFKQKLLSPYTLCSMLDKCPGYTDIDIEQEQKRILAIPKQVNEQKNLRKDRNKDSKILNFLHVSDIHLDQLYEEGAPTEKCGLPFCCQQGQKGEGEAPHWGFFGSCDLPEHTFDQFLNFVGNHIKFDYGIWTGDNISHDAWQNTMDKTISVTELISQKMQEKFGISKTIYPSLGNEDGFPDYQFDFQDNKQNYDNDLKNKFSESWKNWIGEDSAKQMKQKGFYSSFNKDINLKVISLNTLTCNIKNLFLVPNPTDPGNMLDFLEQELIESEQKQQNVYIIGHIPSWDCTQDWSQVYRALIQRFSSIIKSQFFGHTHSDQFAVYRNIFEDIDTPNNALFITPSLTTATHRNPSFRIYQVDSSNMEIINYQQYRLNLDKYNTKGKTATLQWDLSYDFLAQYNLKSMNLNSLNQLALDLKNTQQINFQKYRCNYDTSCHVEGNYQNQSKNLDSIQDSNNTYYCQANFVTPYEYRECLGQNPQGGKIEQILNFIEGPWKQKN